MLYELIKIIIQRISKVYFIRITYDKHNDKIYSFG